MAEHSHEHDGRFGEKFDDELSIPAIVWSGIAILVACVLGIGITLAMWRIDFGELLPRTTPVLEGTFEREIPDGPVLQSSPEGELEAMRAEMEAHLESYAWIDPEAGIARIPIERAMRALAARGVETELAGPGRVFPETEATEAEEADVEVPGSEPASEGETEGASHG